MYQLEFKADQCCGGYVHAEVQHDNGLRSIVEDKGKNFFTVLTLRNWTVEIPLIQELTMDQVQEELSRVAALS